MGMYVSVDLTDLIVKINILVRKELISLFGSVGLDISEYVEKMYRVDINGDEINIDVSIPYSEIIEYGSIGYEEYDVGEIVNWFIKNVNDNSSDAEKFAEMYIVMLNNCDGIYLGHKINKIIEYEFR